MWFPKILLSPKITWIQPEIGVAKHLYEVWSAVETDCDPYSRVFHSSRWGMWKAEGGSAREKCIPEQLNLKTSNDKKKFKQKTEWFAMLSSSCFVKPADHSFPCHYRFIEAMYAITPGRSVAMHAQSLSALNSESSDYYSIIYNFSWQLQCRPVSR